MNLVFINPNSTASMTDKIVAAARASVPQDVRVLGHTCHDSPPVIESSADCAAATPHVVAAARQAAASGADACVIACFDGPGLSQARAAVAIPVIGIGQAAFHAAALLGGTWGVITTTPGAISGMARNLAAYGLEAQCSGIRAAGIRVLDLENPASGARNRVSDEIAEAIARDGVTAIALGCAGMADLAEDFARDHPARMIDGVSVAARLAMMLAGLPGRVAVCTDRSETRDTGQDVTK